MLSEESTLASWADMVWQKWRSTVRQA